MNASYEKSIPPQNEILKLHNTAAAFRKEIKQTLLEYLTLGTENLEKIKAYIVEAKERSAEIIKLAEDFETADKGSTDLLNSIKHSQSTFSNELDLSLFAFQVSDPIFSEKEIATREYLVELFAASNPSVKGLSIENLLLIFSGNLREKIPDFSQIFMEILEQLSSSTELNLAQRKVAILVSEEAAKRVKKLFVFNIWDVPSKIRDIIARAYWRAYKEEKAIDDLNIDALSDTCSTLITKSTINEGHYRDLFERLKNCLCEQIAIYTNTQSEKSPKRLISIEMMQDTLVFLANPEFTSSHRVAALIAILKGHIEATNADHRQTSSLGMMFASLSGSSLSSCYQAVLAMLDQKQKINFQETFSFSRLKQIPAFNVTLELPVKDDNSENTWTLL